MERCLGSPVYHLQRTKQPPTSHAFLFRECSYRNFWLCFDEGQRVMTCRSETTYLSFTVLILLKKIVFWFIFSIADQHSLSCVDACKNFCFVLVLDAGRLAEICSLLRKRFSHFYEAFKVTHYCKDIFVVLHVLHLMYSFSEMSISI